MSASVSLPWDTSRLTLNRNEEFFAKVKEKEMGIITSPLWDSSCANSHKEW
uniref:Uncharacterized protein n=1 Tax=Arundo donax TaxID=35708 RepID=A0A0A9PYH9_ARUDO